MSGSGILNEKKESTGFHLKSMRIGVFLIVLLLSVMAIVPMVSADEKNITINITSPEEGDFIYLDVVPAFISVQGTIDAPHGIRNVTITNGEDVIVSGSNYGIQFTILCDVPCYSYTNHITVTAVDTLGSSASATRNFTRFTGPPGPGTIWVTGWVIEANGQPIPNASIIFETIGERYTITATTKSGADGSYNMKKALGDFQKITVQKEGYQTSVRDVRFKPLYNDLNLTLTPQGRPVPGFGFGSGVSAIIIGLFLITVRKR
jgi:hypothetical protein